MRHLELYTPDICAQLRQIDEMHHWQPWDPEPPGCDEYVRDDLIEDVELTYHLHLAAEVSGARAGMPPLPKFPLCLDYSGGSLHPGELVLKYLHRHPPLAWNQMDKRRRSLCACA